MNDPAVHIKIIETVKDIMLVIAGAGLTYLVQRALFNNQRMIEIDKKEEDIIIEAVKFLNFVSDKTLKLESEKDFKDFYEKINSDYFPKLNLNSFQIKRIEDEKIWNMYYKVLDVYSRFSKLLLSPVISTKPEDFSAYKKNCLDAEKEFVNYCIEYLKIRRKNKFYKFFNKEIASPRLRWGPQ